MPKALLKHNKSVLSIVLLIVGILVSGIILFRENIIALMH